MAASSRFANVSEDDFALKCFFFLFFKIITCVFILKQLFASGSVIIGEYFTDNHCAFGEQLLNNLR